MAACHGLARSVVSSPTVATKGSMRFDSGTTGKRVQRYDLVAGSSVRKIERTVQGFLRVDAVAAHAGIQTYYRPDGKRVRELVLPEHIQALKSLKQFDGASLTNDHPVEGGEHVMVSPANVRKFEVGTVMGPGRADGEDVVISTLWKDPQAIAAIESRRKTAISVGYNVDLDETPGVHPKYGAYDAIQINREINHAALVDAGRAPRASLRMDSAYAVGIGQGKLTSIVDGHQHTLDTDCATTSWASLGGSDTGHSHTVVRNPDGSLVLTENAGHTHTILDAYNTDNRSTNMDPEKLQALVTTLNEQLKTTETELGAATARADAEKLRADTAAGRILTMEAQNKELSAKVAGQVAATETEAYRAEKIRADGLQEKVAKFDETFETRVRERSALVNQATIVLGPKFRADDLDDRQVRVAVIQRLDSTADVSSKIENGIILGRYLSLVEQNLKNVRSQANVESILASHTHVDQVESRADKDGKTLAQKREEFRKQGTKPLPNSTVRTTAR